MTATDAMTAYLTVPTAAHKAELPLDKTRTVVRLHEAELVAAGVILKAGRHRLVRADRLDDLAAVVAGAGQVPA